MTAIRNKDLPVALVDLMEGPRPPEHFVSNGCTCSPDYVGHHDLRAACHWHDYAYSRGGSEADREEADYAFARNLERCGLHCPYVGIYFRRVRLLGIDLFPYDEPLSKWGRLYLRLRVFFTRCLRW